MIILEGPDRAGKTTLAHAIHRRLNSEVKHLGGSYYQGESNHRHRVLVRHWDQVAAEMHFAEQNTVYDRMVLGSIVYAFKKDHHNIQPVTPSEYSDWLDWMEAKGNLLICCLPPLDVILKRMQVGEDYISADEMIHVYRRYQSIFENFKDAPFPVLRYDSSVTSAEDFVHDNFLALQKANIR